nr:MAG TPA: KilAC domain protein [Ackermannviridae sp.]
MNTELTVLQNNEKETISSLDLVKEINVFREQEYKYKIEKGLSLGKVEKKNGKFTELRHDTLLVIIRDEFEEEINDQKILEVKYKDKKGEIRMMYILTLDQAKQILSRESKFVRKAMIKYINQLENKVKELEYELSKRDNLIGKIVTSENQQKRIEYFEIFYNEYVKPNEQKAIFYDKVADNKKYIDFKTVAKLLEDLGFGRNLLLSLLRDKKVLMRDNQPYQIYVDNGYLKTKEIYIDKSNKIAFQPLISQKGLDWLIKKLIEWNYLNKKQVESINTQKLF